MGIIGTILVACRNLRKDSLIYYPQQELAKVAKYIHYIPKQWVDNASNYNVNKKLCKLYQPIVWLILKEIVGTIVNGPLMVFYLSGKSHHIVHFLQNHIYEHPTLERVCNFAVFEAGEDSQEIMTSEYVKQMFDVASNLRKLVSGLYRSQFR